MTLEPKEGLLLTIWPPGLPNDQLPLPMLAAITIHLPVVPTEGPVRFLGHAWGSENPAARPLSCMVALLSRQRVGGMKHISLSLA